MTTESLTKPIGAHRVPQNLNTWPVRHELSALGLRWHQEAECWHTDDAEALRQALLLVGGHLEGAENPESPAAPSPGGNGEGQASEGVEVDAPDRSGEASPAVPAYVQGKPASALTDREAITVLRALNKSHGTPIGNTGTEPKMAKIVRIAAALNPGGAFQPSAGEIAYIGQALAEAAQGQTQAPATKNVYKSRLETNGTPTEGPGTPADSEAGDAEQKAKNDAKQEAAMQAAQQVFGPAGVAAVQALVEAGVNEDEVRRIAREVAREEDEQVVLPAIQQATEKLLERMAEVAGTPSATVVLSPVEVTIRIAERAAVVITGAHRLVPKIAALASALDPLAEGGHRALNIALVGPPGVGKSHANKDVAKALGIACGGSISLSGGVTESALTGRLIPIGNGLYLPAPFILAYKNGGTFLLDEMDAADANVLLAINAALANGGFTVEAMAIGENGKGETFVARHPDFVCLCGMNTWGTGATAQFAGRQALDGATLDRWYPVFMDYDPNIVGMLFGAPPVGSVKPWTPSKEALTDAERIAWQGWWYAVGAKLGAVTSKRIWSPRVAQKVVGARSVGVARKEVVQDLFSGWKPEELARLDDLAKGPVFA